MNYQSADSVLLKNARVPDVVLADRGAGGLRTVDILIENGTITAVTPTGDRPPDGATLRDMDGGLVLPAFADIHTHIDKGHIWPRRPNPDGTWLSALFSVQADRERLWKSEDVERMASYVEPDAAEQAAEQEEAFDIF